VNGNNNLYDLIERYLEGSLPAEERAGFEKMMAADPELKAHAEKTRKVNELIFMEGLSRDLANIKNAEKEYLFRQRFWNYGKWLSGIILFITALSSVWIISSSEENKNIRLTHQTPGPSTVYSEKDKNTIREKTNKIPDSIDKLPAGKNNPISFHSESYLPNTIDSVNRKNLEIKFAPDTTNRKVSEPLTINPCDVSITADFETTISCENRNDGSISIKSFSGGTQPYSVSIDNSSFQKANAFSYLSAGNHHLIIRDAKGCTSQAYQIVIHEKPCLDKNAPHDYVFSYGNSTEWIFPETTENNFTFNLYGSGGNLLYSANIVNGNPSSWNGYGFNNQKLGTGLYIFHFTKSGNIILQGTITVVE
jgi:hypothetical protein